MYIAILSHPKTGSLIQVGTLRIRTVLTDRSTDRARHLKKEIHENCWQKKLRKYIFKLKLGNISFKLPDFDIDRSRDISRCPRSLNWTNCEKCKKIGPSLVGDQNCTNLKDDESCISNKNAIAQSLNRANVLALRG